MQSPEPIDPRYDELVHELRSLPGAPARVRLRVLELAEQEVPERRAFRWRLRPPSVPRRLVGYGLAGCGASLAVAALAVGVVSSGSGGHSEAASTTASAGASAASPHREAAKALQHPPVALSGVTTTQSGALAAPSPDSARVGGRAVTLPPSRGRIARYSAELRLRVKDTDALASATRRAIRVTRSLGGFVATVRYGVPGANGESYLSVRVPAVHVQAAITRFSQLGAILAQNISITDLQDRVNAIAVQIERLRDRIRILQAELKGPLSDEERVQVENRLGAARAQLRALTKQRAATVRSGRLSTITLELTTRKAAVVPPAPSKPGRIERAATKALGILEWYGVVAIYALIVLSPLVLLAVAATAGRRAARRRSDARLLEQT